LSPKGEFWNRLERALDLSTNVSEPAKNDFRLGNSPLGFVSMPFHNLEFVGLSLLQIAKLAALNL
jgi:hypothetical protein